MGVYIKGFPLPNNCGACPLRLAWCRERIYMVNRPDRCPLVPVPPHGRCIDADALMKGEGRYIISFGKEGIDVAEINRAPTIIPAEEEET